MPLEKTHRMSAYAYDVILAELFLLFLCFRRSSLCSRLFAFFCLLLFADDDGFRSRRDLHRLFLELLHRNNDLIRMFYQSGARWKFDILRDDMVPGIHKTRDINR